MLLWPFNKYPGTDYETFNWEWLIGVGKRMEKALYDLFSDTGALHRMVDKVLEEHPEWVTTVMDGAITEPKIYAPFLKVIKNRYITPEMYGAAGDGVTDDTQAFIDCFADAQNQYVYLAGTYKIVQEIDVPDNCHIFGKGVIEDYRVGGYSNYNAVLHGVDLTGASIKGITINGRGAGDEVAYKCGILFENSENIDIEHVTVTNVDYVWAIAGRASDHMTVYDCTVNEYAYGAIGNINEGNDFSVEECTIINARSSNANTYGIMLNGYDVMPILDTLGGKGLRAINNYLYDEAPHWEMIDAHGGTDIVVTGNVMENACCGISIFGDETRHFDVLNAVITDNVINGYPAAVISDNASLLAGGSNVKVAGNVIKNGGFRTGNTHTNAALFARFINNGVVSDNVIEDAYLEGIRIASSHDLRVVDNTIKNVIDASGETGIGIYISNGDFENVIIENNIVDDVNLGIRCARAFANQNPYVKVGQNTINATQDISEAAVDGMLPNQRTSTPTFMSNAKTGDTVICTDSATNSPAGWVWAGNEWREIGAVMLPKNVGSGTAVGGSLTFDNNRKALLVVDVTATAGTARVVVPMVTGTRYYPAQFGTTTGWVRLDCTNGVLTFIGCSESNATFAAVYAM